MSRFVKYAAFAGAMILAAGIYEIVNFDICDTVVVQTLPALDGARKLVVFHRACGATVDFNTHASIVPAGQSFSFDGNPAFVSVSGKTLVTRWLARDKVLVLSPRGEKIFRQMRESDGVTILYGQR
jgi:hypothetical protein